LAAVTIKGGDKLAARLSDIAKALSSPVRLKVGFMENATYPDGTSVALVAAVQEFGSPANNIPPRPFFRNMVAEKSGEWPDAIAALLKAHNYDAAAVLNLTGGAISGQLQASIASFDSVPLKPSTVKAKGFDKQLVDTGNMMKSVTFIVDGG